MGLELAKEKGVAPVLIEETEVTEGTLQRTPVPGSIRVEGNFVFYRPILIMRVRDFNLSTGEWSANVGWSMQLEEV